MKSYLLIFFALSVFLTIYCVYQYFRVKEGFQNAVGTVTPAHPNSGEEEGDEEEEEEEEMNEDGLKSPLLYKHYIICLMLLVVQLGGNGEILNGYNKMVRWWNWQTQPLKDKFMQTCIYGVISKQLQVQSLSWPLSKFYQFDILVKLIIN